MLFLKFSILLVSFNLFAFTGNECFNENFEVEVTHKSFPFGLLSKDLKITKKDCQITVEHNEFKYRNRSWVIDICREPIHVKLNSDSVEVVRKISECKNTSDDFCKEFQSIKRLIQDDGLIFAEGDKTDLGESHGKTYCAYLLVNEYLDKSVIMTRGFDYNYLGTQKTQNLEEAGANHLQIDPNSGKADF